MPRGRVRKWYNVREPEQIESIPWLHPDVVNFLEGLLKPDWHVLEHGAGGSTLWFAERVKCVTSIEHSLNWTLAVRQRAPANVTLLSSLPDPLRKYDLFLVDGDREERAVCLANAERYVKPKGWIVLDNANHIEYQEERDGLQAFAKLVERFDRNMHCFRFLITEFWKCD